MYTLILRHYYWPYLTTDVLAYVATCRKYLAYRVTQYSSHHDVKLLSATGPLEVVAMIILGALQTSTKQNKYILVICDCFSKVTQTLPLRTVTISTCIRAFYHGWVLHYEVPIHELTDHVKQLVDIFCRTLCVLLSINLVLATFHYPQNNGQKEGSKKTIIAS